MPCCKVDSFLILIRVHVFAKEVGTKQRRSELARCIFNPKCLIFLSFKILGHYIIRQPSIA